SVTAADYHDVFAAEEEAIARGAGGDAGAAERLLARQSEPARLRARADQQTLRDIVVAGVAEAHEGTLRQVGFHDDVGDNTGADVLGLLAHLLHDPGSLDHLSEARIVLDVGGD